MVECRVLDEVPPTPRAMGVESTGWPEVVIADTCPTRTERKGAALAAPSRERMRSIHGTQLERSASNPVNIVKPVAPTGASPC